VGVYVPVSKLLKRLMFATLIILECLGHGIEEVSRSLCSEVKTYLGIGSHPALIRFFPRDGFPGLRANAEVLIIENDSMRYIWFFHLICVILCACYIT
jgi:hypothetical protein